MAEGKWSVQEAIAHIMAYDESFLKSAVIPLENGREPHFADKAENQSFNENAAALGRKIAKAQLLERAIHARRQLVDHLQRLPATAFQTKPAGRVDDDFTELLDRDFASHDRSHIEQIRKFLKSHGYHDLI
jgi:uncharacterized damage-inducible protein DinB